jgi:diaminopropionate ammonia-lyase
MAVYDHVSNPRRLSQAAEADAAVCVQNLSNWNHAIDEISTWPEYTPQPLHSMPKAAVQLRLGNLFL